MVRLAKVMLLLLLEEAATSTARDSVAQGAAAELQLLLLLLLSLSFPCAADTYRDSDRGAEGVESVKDGSERRPRTRTRTRKETACTCRVPALSVTARIAQGVRGKKKKNGSLPVSFCVTFYHCMHFYIVYSFLSESSATLPLSHNKFVFGLFIYIQVFSFILIIKNKRAQETISKSTFFKKKKKKHTTSKKKKGL